jgi:hypothetical protein
MPEQIQIIDEVKIVAQPAVEPAEFPLRVVPEWDELVKQASHVARLIDRHLDYEERGRRLLPNERLMPIGLCPEQRVNMTTDILALTGS